MTQVLFFDKVKVLQLSGLSIVTGVAAINYTPTEPEADGWTRTPFGFLVPDASGNPLSFANLTDASCIVYPTAFANANSQDFGWAVDSSTAIVVEPNQDQVDIIVNLAARTDANTILFRIGFQVNVNGTVAA